MVHTWRVNIGEEAGPDLAARCWKAMPPNDPPHALTKDQKFSRSRTHLPRLGCRDCCSSRRRGAERTADSIERAAHLDDDKHPSCFREIGRPRGVGPRG